MELNHEVKDERHQVESASRLTPHASRLTPHTLSSYSLTFTVAFHFNIAVKFLDISSFVELI
jgi:hypothetical protein